MTHLKLKLFLFSVVSCPSVQHSRENDDDDDDEWEEWTEEEKSEKRKYIYIRFFSPFQEIVMFWTVLLK